jgi:hypothetical protein
MGYEESGDVGRLLDEDEDEDRERLITIGKVVERGEIGESGDATRKRLTWGKYLDPCSQANRCKHLFRAESTGENLRWQGILATVKQKHEVSLPYFTFCQRCNTTRVEPPSPCCGSPHRLEANAPPSCSFMRALDVPILSFDAPKYEPPSDGQAA